VRIQDAYDAAIAGDIEPLVALFDQVLGIEDYRSDQAAMKAAKSLGR
jgi:hypothetical protein